MKLWKTTATAVWVVALTIGACSVDDLIDANRPLGIEDGASAGTKESLKVDGSKEVTLELETGATLSVPKGAVDHNVMLAVERPSDSKAIKFVETLKQVKAVASAPYVLTPHGTEFLKDIKLEIPVVNNKDRELVVAYLKDEDDRTWKFLGSPTVENDIATVTLKHFSVVVLLDRARSGFAAEADDAGAPAAGDAGDEDEEEEDASAEELDAGVETGADAGASTTSDAGVMDAGQADASEPPTTAVDGGTSQGHEAGTGADDSGSALPEAGEPSETGTAPVDAGADPDAGREAGGPPDVEVPACQPTACEELQCGQIPDGCGNYMECGNCEDGGVCDFYEAGVCGFPVG